MAKFIEVTIPDKGKAVKTLINVGRILKVEPYNNGNESYIYWEVPAKEIQFAEVASIPYAELVKILTE